MQIPFRSILRTTFCVSLAVFAQDGHSVGDAPSLPRAEDFLPRGEVSKGSLVVSRDGYRFQIRPQFKLVSHPRANLAYRGTLEGFMQQPGEITMYATRERFTRDLAALVKRDIASISSKGGKISFNTPVKIHIAGELDLAHRFLATVDGKLDLHVLAVYHGSAYILHVETPALPSPFRALANMGSDLMIRGSTFHVAPPDLRRSTD